MSEAIRTCKRCGRKYTGWHCTNPACKIARAKRNASQRRSRARNSGGGSRTRRYAATGSFSWGSRTIIGPVYADACPPPPVASFTLDDVEEIPY